MSTGPDDDLWETRQRLVRRTASPEGADPEYEEQILPLVAEHLAGAGRVLDVGCGEGQVARLALLGDADLRDRGRPHLGPVVVARKRGGGPSYGRAGGRRPAVRPTAPSMRWWPAWCSSTSMDVDERHRARSPRARAPVGASCFLLNHPLLQTPNSGWIDDQVLDPPEQYWRIGPYLIEDETIEEVEKDVFIPFIHRPLSALPQRPRRRRPPAAPHGGARPAAGLPRPRPRVRRGGHHPAPAVPPRSRSRTA